jgi:alcohol dehydrogenase YqhD (iron-dependent ADH family)
MFNFQFLKPVNIVFGKDSSGNLPSLLIIRIKNLMV